MGWWSDVRDRTVGGTQNLFANPNDWAGNVWSDIQEGGRQLDETLFGWLRAPDIDVPPLSDSVGQLGSALAPGDNSQTINQMASRVRSGLAAAGANEAAQAAGAQRAKTAGLLGMAPVSMEYWKNLQTLANNLGSAADQIPTTSSELAFLNGFTNGGGFGGMATLGAGLFGGDGGGGGANAGSGGGNGGSASVSSGGNKWYRGAR